AGHVDVGQHEYQRHVFGPIDLQKRTGRRLRELHHEAAGLDVAAELLAEQRLDIGLVVDHQDQQAHASPPDFASEAAARGSTMRNSVNSPGWLSTSIVPACCLTTMSWLSDSPSPVPSPAGLVVKNGVNIFSFTSGGMPVPLSRILISTLSPRLFVVAERTGSKAEPPFSLLRLVTA